MLALLALALQPGLRRRPQAGSRRLPAFNSLRKVRNAFAFHLFYFHQSAFAFFRIKIRKVKRLRRYFSTEPLIAELVDQFSTITIRTSSVYLKVKSSICTSPLYRKEAWLRQKYLVEKLSARQIGVLIGCSHDAVNRALKKFGMIREPSKHGRLGYEVGWSRDGRFYEKSRMKTVKWMSDLRERGVSYREIARRLEKKGIPTPSGKPKWYACTVRLILTRAQKIPKIR